VGFVVGKAEPEAGSSLMATSRSAVGAGCRRERPGATFEALTED